MYQNKICRGCGKSKPITQFFKSDYKIMRNNKIKYIDNTKKQRFELMENFDNELICENCFSAVM